MKKTINRITAIILSVIFIISILPVTVSAANWKCPNCSTTDNADCD